MTTKSDFVSCEEVKATIAKEFQNLVDAGTLDRARAFASSLIIEESSFPLAKLSSPKSSFKIDGISKRQYRRYINKNSRIYVYAPVNFIKQMAVFSDKTKEFIQ